MICKCEKMASTSAAPPSCVARCCCDCERRGLEVSKAASSGRDGLPAFAGTGGSRWSFCVSLRFREVMAAELSFRKVDDDAEQKRPARPFQTPTHHFARTVQDGIHAPSTMLRAVCDGCSTQCCSCFDLESVQHIEASEADLGGRRPSAIRQARRQGQEDHRRRLSCRLVPTLQDARSDTAEGLDGGNRRRE